MFKRSKYGFAKFINKTLPIPSLSYTPLTRKSFSRSEQLKKNMRVVVYLKRDGLVSSRRTQTWIVGKVDKAISVFTIKIVDEEGSSYYVLSDHLHFYEEERALGRVP